MPDPGGADDVVELGVTGLPTQVANGVFGAGDEDGGIAGATRVEFCGNRMAGDAASRFDDFANTEPMAIAEVVDESASSGDIGFEGFESEQMSVGEIGDVDVIADAGAVGSRVVIAIDADGVAASEGDVENQRNQVRFGLVIFASRDAFGALRRASDVEVAKGNGAQAVEGMEPVEHGLDHQLRFAIDVRGLKTSAFSDGDRFGLAVNGCCGGEDEPARPLGDDSFEHGQGGSGVVTEVGFRVDHRFASFDERSEMKDGIEGLTFALCRSENLLNQVTICEIAFDEFHARRNHLAACVTEVVKYNWLMTLREKQRGNRAPDITGTAGNQSSHKNSVLPERFGLP